MSCDWDVYCLDCDSVAGIEDANREESLMRVLIKHAKAIGGLLPLWDDNSTYQDVELRVGRYDVELRVGRYDLDPKWFAEHASHRLIPRNEYGECSHDCGERFTCGECGALKTCRRTKGHDGGHSEKRDPPLAHPS
jgi:hypothetical protein